MVRNEIELQGTGVSPGVRVGRIFHLRAPETFGAETHGTATVIRDTLLDYEATRIQDALSRSRRELDLVRARSARRYGKRLADIFFAQKAMLEDSSVLDRLEASLKTKRVNGEAVVREVFSEYESRLRESGAAGVADRGDDVADLSRRVLRNFLPRSSNAAEQLAESNAAGPVQRTGWLHPGSRALEPRFGTSWLLAPATIRGVLSRIIRRNALVAVISDIYPSDIVRLPEYGVGALLLARCSAGSHAALLAREIGIPIVSGIDPDDSRLEDGERALVDGITGVVRLNPGSESIRTLRRARAVSIAPPLRDRIARAPTVRTRSGTNIEVHANVGSVEEAHAARRLHANGIGLLRLEMYYLSRSTAPSEDEIFCALQDIARPFNGRPIHVRLLDAGGDKQLPYLDTPRDDNPFLGIRGVRLLLRRREILTPQLRALLRLHQTIPIRIVVPLVTVADDVSAVRSALHAEAEQLRCGRIPEIGSMIEIPAAALCIEQIAAVADFLCIGTNDLAQYALAADRSNPEVAAYYQMRHPAVYALVRHVVDRQRQKSIMVCGDIASDSAAIAELIACGISSVSVAPQFIVQVRNAIRSL